jgi:hypothetical protein
MDNKAKVFKILCETNIDEAKAYLVNHKQLLQLNNYNSCIEICCFNGYFEMAHWIIQENSDFDITINNNYLFRQSCRHGHLIICQYLFGISNDIPIKDLNIAFMWSCECGHLELAKWIYSIGAETDYNSDFGFKWSCINGHLEIGQWLHSIKSRLVDEFTFNLTCACNRYCVAQWLMTIDKHHTCSSFL